MSVVTPPDSAAGRSCGRDQVDVAVDGAGCRDQAVAHDRLGVRTDRQLDAVADRVVAGAADADDPAVLDADVGLDDADDRVDDERARRPRRRAPSRTAGPASSAGGWSWRSPRSARRLAPGGPPRRGSRGRCRRGGRGRRSSARSARGARRGRGGSPSVIRRYRDAAPTVRVSPGAQRSRRAGRQVEPEAGRGRAVELEAPVHALERVVARDPDDAAWRCSAPRVATRRGGPRRSTAAAWPDRRPARRRPGRRPSGSTRTTSRVAVVHQHLEPHVADEVGHAGQCLRRASRRRDPPRSTSAYVAPPRAASSIASQMRAIASGAFSRRPAHGAGAPARPP